MQATTALPPSALDMMREDIISLCPDDPERGEVFEREDLQMLYDAYYRDAHDFRAASRAGLEQAGLAPALVDIITSGGLHVLSQQ